MSHSLNDKVQIDKALKLHQEGNFPLAEEIYQSILESNPDNAFVLSFNKEITNGTANNTKVIHPSPFVPLIVPTIGAFTHGMNVAKAPSPATIRIANLCLFIFF
jgi:hypothetical protein